jgi:hypothetical protein
MTFEEFLAKKVATAQEYACGITVNEEDIARDAWEAATRNEREACAKVCENLYKKDGDYWQDGEAFATAIRARSEVE